MYRQVGWLLALEDPINVVGRAAILIDKVRSIRNQAALGNELALEIAGNLWRAASVTIRLRCKTARGPAVTISPPLEVVANVIISRSISVASRVLIAVTSIANDDAADWIAANWPSPAEITV